MPNNITIGQIGEDVAAQYLLNNKYKIIDRNVRYQWGEIDIIAKNKEGVLIFVEVKALKMFHASVKHSQNCSTQCFTPLEIGKRCEPSRSLTGFTPEENLHTTKLNKVKRTAYLYANSHPDLISEDTGWRIDLIAIEIHPHTYKEGKMACHQSPESISPKELIKHCEIRHYENI